MNRRALWCRISAAAIVTIAASLTASGCAPEISAPQPRRTVVARFDPTADPPVLPQPSDVLRNPATGLLDIPDRDGATAAERELNAYLRSLDGFPPETPVIARFDAALLPASVKPANTQVDGSVVLFDLTAMQPLTADDYTPSLVEGDRAVSLVPHLSHEGRPARERWRLGHSYFAILFGGPTGLRAADPDVPVVASPAMFYVRSAAPLLSKCGEGAPDPAAPSCLCPSNDGVFDDSCRVAAGLARGQAEALEPLRRRISALLDQLLPIAAPEKRRADVALAFTFTIAHGPFVAFDPGANRIPLPNDLRIDRATGRVKLPAPTDAAGKALAKGLASLDGFSTTSAVTVPIEQSDDNRGAPPLGAKPNDSVLLLNITTPSSPPDFTVSPERINGGRDWNGLLALSPRRPLRPDQTVYLGTLTDGVRDSKGRRLRPSLPMRLAILTAPLVDDRGRSTLPEMLSDEAAAELEPLRLDYAKAGVWAELAAPPHLLPRERVAGVWLFRTQSMTRVLRDLAAFPSARALSTEVQILDVRPPSGALGPDVGATVHATMRTHVALSGDGAPGSLLDLAGGREVTVPLLFIAPRGDARGVAIVQHGIGGWRGDVRGVAQAFTQAGWAVAGIDVNFHGQRAACTRNEDCEGGGACGAGGRCSTSLLVRCTADSHCKGSVPGACDPKTGACAGGFALDTALCMSHAEKGAPVVECNPAASGAGFLLLPDPFALRDNLRQHVLDLAQLSRVLAADGPGSLREQLVALSPAIRLDGARVALVGQSLGAIEGALFLAAAPRPLLGVLSAPGGRLVDLLAGSAVFGQRLDALLAGWAVPADSTARARTLDLLRWALDPADPVNFGRYIAAEPFDPNIERRVLVQQAGADDVIPGACTEALAAEIGLPLLDGKIAVKAIPAANPQAPPQPISTYFSDAGHGFFTSGEPATSAAQRQAVTFIDSDGKLATPAK